MQFVSAYKRYHTLMHSCFGVQANIALFPADIAFCLKSLSHDNACSLIDLLIIY